MRCFQVIAQARESMSEIEAHDGFPVEVPKPDIEGVGEVLVNLLHGLEDARFILLNSGNSQERWLTDECSPMLAEMAFRLERLADGSLFSVGLDGGMLVSSKDQVEFWFESVCKNGKRIESFRDRFVNSVENRPHHLVWSDIGPALRRLGGVVARNNQSSGNASAAHVILHAASELMFWSIVYQDTSIRFPLYENGSADGSLGRVAAQIASRAKTLSLLEE